MRRVGYTSLAIIPTGVGMYEIDSDFGLFFRVYLDAMLVF